MTETGLFANESVPYAPFKTVGTEYSGRVTRTGKVQQRAYVPPNKRAAGAQGDLEWWDPETKQRPKWCYIVTIQTDLRDPQIPGDDGQRSIWIAGKQMEDAVKKAVKESGASRDGIMVGGWFAMKLTHTTPNDWTDTPTKHYQVSYRAPEPGATEIVAGPAAGSDPWAAGAPPQSGFAASGLTPEVQALLAKQQQAPPF